MLSVHIEEYVYTGEQIYTSVFVYVRVIVRVCVCGVCARLTLDEEEESACDGDPDRREDEAAAVRAMEIPDEADPGHRVPVDLRDANIRVTCTFLSVGSFSSKYANIDANVVVILKTKTPLNFVSCPVDQRAFKTFTPILLC